MRQHAVSTVRGLAAAGYCLKAEALRLAAAVEALRLAAAVEALRLAAAAVAWAAAQGGVGNAFSTFLSQFNCAVKRFKTTKLHSLVFTRARGDRERPQSGRSRTQSAHTGFGRGFTNAFHVSGKKFRGELGHNVTGTFHRESSTRLLWRVLRGVLRGGQTVCVESSTVKQWV